MTLFRRDKEAAAGRSAPDGDAYQRKKLREAQRQRKQSAAAREIGPIPAVADPARKAAALEYFRTFCETYFPARFSLAWSDDHLVVLNDFQRCIVDGGLQAVAMPRGSGKTSLVECGVLWADFRGCHELIALIGATEEAGKEMLSSLVTELQTNDLLAADFPEVCHAIRQLEGINQRRLLLDGRRVSIKLTDRYIVLPNIPPNPAASSVIKVAGLTGRVRGMKFTRPDGRVVRPKLVIIDDPQTDKSAKSPVQNNRREELVAGPILGLAGPRQKISAILPCTVIAEGDLADRFLDREKHPEWNGRRTKLLPEMPEDLDLWGRYAEARADGMRAGDGGEAGNAFYAKHRKAMDRGARAAWPARHNPDELSAIQHAMNLCLNNRKAFYAEYQNDPQGAEEGEREFLEADEIARKLNGIPRGTVPAELPLLTAGIDVQKDCLYWLAAAWGEGFAGGVVDYGSFPDQRRNYFVLADVRKTIAQEFPKAGFEGALFAALERLVEALLTREFPCHGVAGVLRVKRILIDAGWGRSSNTIYQFCRSSKHSALLLPSHGKGLSARMKPMDSWKVPPPGRKGDGWTVTRNEGRAIPHATIDTNSWKTHVQIRLATALGDRGCLALFGRDPRTHEMLADHLTAEMRNKTFGQGRWLDEWNQKPGHPDNHFLDCLVASAVGASIEGVTFLPMQPRPAKKPRKKVSYLNL